MAGKYGTFKVAEDRHISIGNDEVDLAAGEITPTDEVTAAACRQLCGVSCRQPGDESSWVMAEQTEGPDPEPVVADPPPAQNSPAPPTSAGASQASPAPSLADAEAELEKAQADIAAAQKSQNPPI